MARQWRLRHKMVLGLVLILASLGLLLGGTLQGLHSYDATMKTTASKFAELGYAQQLKVEITNLIEPLTQQGGEFQPMLPTDRLRKAQEAFATCRYWIEHDRLRGYDPSPYQEKVLIDDLTVGFIRFEEALLAVGDLRIVDAVEGDPKSQELAITQRRLLQLAEELQVEIVSSVFDKLDRAKWNHRLSFTIVIGATVTSIVVLLTLVYLFSGWIFQPIRTLQSGVQRVSGGMFTQPIGLKSGDELQELADAFDQMTQRLGAIYQDLEHQVNERSRQLVRSERMVSVGFLAAGVAHEINNPLASISFCSEALESRLRDVIDDMPPNDAEVVRKYLRMIHQEAFRCKGITSKLLEFSRVGERRREPTELTDLIKGVLEITQHLQNCHGKHIVFQPMHRVTAGVNGQDIKSVVLNLVVNALDSMDDGGTLTITLQARGPTAEITFVDTGCGMTPDVLDNIFEPFFTRSRTGKGTGLGLFISHQIIDQHAGTLEVASAGPGRGTTFVIRVPLQAVEPRPALTLRTEAESDSRVMRAYRPDMPMEDGRGNAAA